MNNFRDFTYVSSYLHLKRFSWKRRDCPVSSKMQILRSCKVILENSFRVLKVTSKWKTLKQPVYFLRAVYFWPTFDIQIDITFGYILEKIAKLHFLESPQHSYQWGHPLRNKIVYFWRLYFQNKNCCHFEFLMNQIFGQRFIIFY